MLPLRHKRYDNHMIFFDSTMSSLGNHSTQSMIECHSASAGWLRLRAAARWREASIANRAAIPWSVLAVTMAALLLGAGSYIVAVTGRPIGFLLRDANAIAEQPWYFAALENAGIVLMSGGGCVALFSATLCRGRSARFLFLGGLLSLLLAADDLYQLHENSYRLYLNEGVIFAFYGALLLLLVGAHLQHFVRTPFVMLGLALALFGAAIVIDHFPAARTALPPGTEDCLELIGICFWSAYFVKCSRDGLLEHRIGHS